MGPGVGVVQRCFQQTPTPSSVSLQTLTAERAELYTPVPPLLLPIPIEIDPLPVDDNIPEEEDIYEWCCVCNYISLEACPV